MENNNISQPTSGGGLGIAGLVLGIIALPLALLGCTSVFALLLAILGVAFSAVALSQAKKTAAPTSLITAAMIISIIALSFAGLKFTNSLIKINRFPWEMVNNKINDFEHESDEFSDAFEEEFEKELGGDLEDVLRDLEDELEVMEDELEAMTDDIEKAAYDLTDNEEAARKLGRAAGKAVREFVDEINDSTDIKVHIEVD